MASQSITKTVTANGDKVNWNLVISGDSLIICQNAQTAFVIPSGVSLTGLSDVGSSIINVPQGFYNLTNNIWFIGDLAIGQQLNVTFEYTVDDITLKDPNDNRFLVTAQLTSSCAENPTTDNLSTLVIEVIDPCTQVSLSIGVDDDATATSSADLSIG